MIKNASKILSLLCINSLINSIIYSFYVFYIESNCVQNCERNIYIYIRFVRVGVKFAQED